MSTLIEKLEQIKTEKQQISSAFGYASQAGVLTGDVSAIAFSDYSNTVSSIVSIAVDAVNKYNALSGEYEQLSTDYDELSTNYGTLSGEYEQLSTDYDELSMNYDTLSGEYEQLSTNYNTLSTENANALSIADQILS